MHLKQEAALEKGENEPKISFPAKRKLCQTLNYLAAVFCENKFSIRFFSFLLAKVINGNVNLKIGFRNRFFLPSYAARVETRR